MVDEWCDRCNHEARYCYKRGGFHVIDGFPGTEPGGYIWVLCKFCGEPYYKRKRGKKELDTGNTIAIS